MRNMETGTTQKLLQLEVRNSAHMILAHRRVCHTCLGTHLRHLRFQSPAHYSAERWRTALEKSSWAVPTLWPKCPHLRLLRFLSHSSIQRWEVEDGFGEKLLGCAQLVTKVPRTQSPAHMELTQRSWSCVSQIWAIWEKKFLLQQSWMPCPNFD